MDDNRFESKGGEQNIAQGDRPIGKQTNNYGVSEKRFTELVGELAVTDSALRSFFKVLEEQQVPRGDLDSRLREIAGQYKELLLRLETVQSEDPEVVRLKKEAGRAVAANDYAKAEELLNRAEGRDLQAIEELERAARQRRISAAETNEALAQLQEVQLRYARAAEYYQKAVKLLPDDRKEERALYLHEAGYDLYRIARYSEALPLYEQSLTICREIGDRTGEGRILNNIGMIYYARGDYTAALPLYEQSLAICREIGDRAAGEGMTLNNISQIHHARGDYPAALTYLDLSLTIHREIGDREGEGVALNNIAGIYHQALGDYDTALSLYERSLTIRREIGDRAGEWTTLNNIGQIHRKRGDYTAALPLYEQNLAISQEIDDRAGEGVALNNIGQIYQRQDDCDTALTYLEQSLGISCDIGDRRQEAVTSWNVGRLVYGKQGALVKAEQYISRAVQLAEDIGHPSLEKYRRTLRKLRAEIRKNAGNK